MLLLDREDLRVETCVSYFQGGEDMTRDADNDNPGGALRRALEREQSWQNMSDGNAALAHQPAVQSDHQSGLQPDHQDVERPDSDVGEQASAISSDELELQDQPAQMVDQLVDQPARGEHDIAAPVIETTAGVIPSSNAIPISALGIAMPHRPTPAVRRTALQPAPVPAPAQTRARARRRPRPADLGKQGSEHLFNRPPGAPAGQAEPSPMEKAINAKPRKPLTAQPGFVAGLASALVFGAAFYAYLVL